MEHFVYIIENEEGIRYKGYTSRPKIRLSQHNDNKGRFTAGKGPWRLVFLQKCSSKKKALIREKQLKRANYKYISWLIEQNLNSLIDEGGQKKHT